jgi:two-component SAPR family response regulator
VATILILDEETDSLKLLKRLLERNAHCVRAFVRPSDAVQCAAAVQLDLALVNVTSRRDSALAVLDELRTVNPGLKTMVIADYVPEETLEAVSADGFLVKPVDIDAVERKVRELLQSRSPDLDSSVMKKCNITRLFNK